MLNVALWIVQGLLAGVFTLTGTTKLVLPREVLEKRMHWAATWPPWCIKLLGLAEVAGAVGLVVPAATGVAPVLTPIAALCLAVLMVGAVGTHRRLGESVVRFSFAAGLVVNTAEGVQRSSDPGFKICTAASKDGELAQKLVFGIPVASGVRINDAERRESNG